MGESRQSQRLGDPRGGPVQFIDHVARFVVRLYKPAISRSAS